jgi:hypothetical protein
LPRKALLLSKMSSVEQVDQDKAAEEAAALKPEEKPFLDGALKSVKYPDNFTDVDRLQIIRGYQTYEPRDEETTKAFKMIEDWRQEIGYADFLLKEHALAQQFHTHYWEETIYGVDKFGHVLIGLKYMAINTDEVCKMDEAELVKIVGQKLASYSKHKLNLSKKVGAQRYKQSFIIDLKGGGMGVLNGTKRKTVQKVFNVGSDYFPETVWKIYVYHTPMMFRAIWSIASAFIHPITKAKVNILSGSKQVAKLLMENDGFKEADVPEMLGGKNKGISSYELLKQMIKQETDERAATAAAAAAAPEPSVAAAAPAPSGGDAPAAAAPAPSSAPPSAQSSPEKPKSTLI